MANQKSDVWQKILTIRSNKRFTGLELANQIFDSFFEVHGDRKYGDDPSIVGGLAYLQDHPVTIIIQYKGKGVNERLKNRNGMTLPEGYRKALRIMKQAEKFGRPVICIVDTPGAYPGIDAEQRGQAEAIARNMYEMSMLTVPIVSVVISEGGSGGALALTVANHILMLENAIFSVVSPEGCASILWKDSSRAPQAAEYLNLTADDLLGLKICDYIIKESPDISEVAGQLKKRMIKSVEELQRLTKYEIQQQRLQKFRNMGICC